MMEELAFKIFNQILYLHVVVGKKIQSFVGIEVDIISRNYKNAVQAAKQDGNEIIRKIEEQLKSGWGWFSYMPPESKGALISSIADALNQPNYANDFELRKLAAFSINELLSTTQSNGHLNNTLDRINVALGGESGRNQGVAIINSIVEGTKFADCISRCTAQLDLATPLLGRVFLRNDEPAFHIAQFPLHHPAYHSA
jgi:hypothetical protein